MASEKEKMLSGKPYKAFSPELENERFRARKLIHTYNQLAPDEKEKAEKSYSQN